MRERRADWRRFSAELPTGYRCAALDFYGYGSTPPWPGPAALTIDDQAHLVATLARSIGVPVHLCGHSYGGSMALRLVVTQPELVRTLTLIEPQCYPDKGCAIGAVTLDLLPEHGETRAICRATFEDWAAIIAPRLPPLFVEKHVHVVVRGEAAQLARSSCP